jgi:hypothetical protein
MKIIQSFWTGGNSSEIPSCGWYSEKYHLLGWILSVNQLVKYYDEVELVTDRFGYDLLIEKLQLPYTDVHVVLDELNSYPKDLWALAKIKAYQMQKEPFLHIDGDVFVWERFSDELLNANLVAQNIETTSDYYRTMWADIRPHLTHLPASMELFDQSIHNKAYNMGIFGGNNLAFLQQYCKASFDFVDKNQENFANIDQFNFNIFFEQVLFHEMAQFTNQRVHTYINEDIGDNQYANFGNFDDVPHKRTYLHLLGDFKRQLFVCKKLETYVIQFYPAFYKRLEALLNLPTIASQVVYDYTVTTNQKLIENYALRVQNKTEISAPQQKIDLLARDMYITGKLATYHEFLLNDRDFVLKLLPGFTLDREEKLITIQEFDDDDSLEDFMLIDQVIFNELITPQHWETFTIKALNYVSDDFPESQKEAFIKTVSKRIAYFITLKIIVALAPTYVTTHITQEII